MGRIVENSFDFALGKLGRRKYGLKTYILDLESKITEGGFLRLFLSTRRRTWGWMEIE